jgi:hypothetical protein
MLLAVAGTRADALFVCLLKGRVFFFPPALLVTVCALGQDLAPRLVGVSSAEEVTQAATHAAGSSRTDALKVKLVRVMNEQNRETRTLVRMRLIFIQRRTFRRYIALRRQGLAGSDNATFAEQINRAMYWPAIFDPVSRGARIARCVVLGLAFIAAVVATVLLATEWKVVEKFLFVLCVAVLLFCASIVLKAAIYLNEVEVDSAVDYTRSFCGALNALCNAFLLSGFGVQVFRALYVTVFPDRKPPVAVTVVTFAVLGALCCYAIAMQIYLIYGWYFVFDASELLGLVFSVLVGLCIVAVCAVALVVVTRRADSKDTVRAVRLVLGAVTAVAVTQTALLVVTVMTYVRDYNVFVQVQDTLETVAAVTVALFAILYLFFAWAKAARPNAQQGYAVLLEEKASGEVPQQYVI